MHRRALLRASSAALAAGSALADTTLNQGQLQLNLGRKDEALASFRAGAEAGPPGMIEYLNRDAIRTIDSPR